MIKVGIVGCGTIGTKLAHAVQSQFSRHAIVSYLIDLDRGKAKGLSKSLKSKPRLVSLKVLVQKSDLIIESASHAAVHQLLPLASRYRKKIMILSVGGLLNNRGIALDRLRSLLYVPSGAVAGIDALLAGHQGKLNRVVITTRKPLRSFESAPYFKGRAERFRMISKPTLIFEGSALEAVRAFPENVNVAATLSLAGIGPKKTRVRLYASPTYKMNSHEIEIQGRFGCIRTLTENVPSNGNPKTSALAVYSAIACLEKIFSPVKIGT